MKTEEKIGKNDCHEFHTAWHRHGILTHKVCQ